MAFFYWPLAIGNWESAHCANNKDANKQNNKSGHWESAHCANNKDANKLKKQGHDLNGHHN